MKNFFFVAIAILFTSKTFCQTKISIDSVASHIGENVTVCDKVYGTKSLKKLTFIDLGAAYPKSLLTVVIFAKDRSNFKDEPEVMYAGKNICVTGVIKQSRDKTEIIINSPNDIELQ